MRPPPFALRRPATVAEALEILAREGDDARPLAGGQSLMPMLVMRLARPAVLVDLNRCAGLDHVAREGAFLRVGAMARQHAVEHHPAVREAAPLLAAALSWAGPRAVRNRGTLGGTLAHADPAAEAPCAALALDAVLVAEGPAGRREIAARDFFLDGLVTALAPGEMLVEARFPAAPPGARHAFLEAGVRRADLALAAVAVRLVPAADGTLGRVAIACVGAGPTALRLRAAEAMLEGRRPTPAALRDAARAALAACRPPSDLAADAEHRRAVLEGLVPRAIAEALEDRRLAA